MATDRPKAALDLKVSAAAATTQEGNPNASNIPSVAESSHKPHPPQIPLRPPRGLTNLVQPKDELQPPPAATTAASASPTSVKSRNGGAGGAVASGGVVGVRKSTCPQCTNISIMQLFYEMKQKFPAVSDDLVNECVLDYCHQKDKCLAALQEHSESNQTLIPQSSYPAKALRASAENILGTKARRGGAGGRVGGAVQEECDNNSLSRQSNTNTIPRRTKGGGAIGAALMSAAVPLVGMVSGGCGERINNGSSNFRRQSDTNNPKLQQGIQPSPGGDVLLNGGSFLSNNIQRMAISGAAGGGVNPPVGSKLERPCTLNLSPAPHRPFRAAPPIPSTTSSTSSLSSLSTATDLASANSPQLTASNESINVSVNVTLSPILTPRSTMGHVSKPPIPPPRHTTELTVQPEMLPFATAATTAGGAMPTRSYTSVNFTLRQPGGGEGGEGTSGGGGGGAAVTAAPIDITTAGSSMTYSSSSYNAKQGYQSQLQITVGNGGGSISAIRTKAPIVVPTPAAASQSSAGSLMRMNLVGATTRLDADTEEVLINRQLQSKWKLSTELDKYRKCLDGMQRDVRMLEMPLPVSAPDQLQEEIKRLQTVCDRMASAVEQAGNFALGETNEAFYQRLESQPGNTNAQRTLNPGTPTSTATTTTTTTTLVPGSPATGGSSPRPEGNESNETEAEGWICSQCTFQNHPELNMCEQCGMVKRLQPQQQQQTMHHLLQQQQQQQQHQPPGIVQITSSQFIPALVQNPAANYNQNPAHLGAVPTNMNVYQMQQQQHGYFQHHQATQQSPRIMYSPPMHQYPPMFAYPGMGTPTSNVLTTPSSGGGGSSVTSTPSPGAVIVTPPATGSGSSGRSKGKKGGKFNSKLSQSISNLFSSSSSSSTTANSHTNSQE